MRKYISLIAFFCGIIFLMSCGVHYQSPPKNPLQTSTLRGHQTREGLISLTWSIFTVEVIDDVPVQSLKNDSKIGLNSGAHNLVLSAFFSRGFGLGPYKARGDITMNFVAGRDYKVNGRAEGSRMRLWIEDVETSMVVSTVLNLPYQDAPQTPYVPIYLPMN
jgi:hypothetical protein